MHNEEFFSGIDTIVVGYKDYKFTA